MPTKISEIYDACVNLIETTLPTDYLRIPNPYTVDVNTFLHLRKGFGLAIGPGVDTQRYVGCLVTWERTFSILLVKQVIATQNDVEVREVIEKDLLDDHDALRKAFCSNSTLGSLAIKSTVLGDAGVNFIDGERLKFLGLVMDLFVEYQEDPNT